MVDVAVLIHGVVGRRTGTHERDYGAMRKGLSRRGVTLGEPEWIVEVEWGWPHPEAVASGDLAVAQDRLRAALADANRSDRISGIWVRGLRELVQFGWSDIVWYATAEGSAAVRHDVWSQIMNRLPPEAPCDLTIVGHSLGALVAHDFLYYLFSGVMREERARVCATPAEWDRAEANWRVRRLVTMGSAVGPLLIRNSLARVAHESPPWIEPAELGLGQPAHSGEAPVWLNVWDRHDILSFPVSGAYGGGRVIDLYPDLSDWPTRAHSRYWRSRKVHRALARFWDA